MTIPKQATLFRAAVALAGCAAVGCATIISGKTQNLRVTSVPPGATVVAEPGGYRVTTPAEITLRRKDAPYRLTFSLDGHEPYSVTISSGTNGWVWGNLILGGIIGIIVDSSTGAANKLEPGEVHANLIRAGLETHGSNDRRLFVFSAGGDLLAAIGLE